METAEYQGKKYRKMKSLAPVEVLKDIKTECEKKHFTTYSLIFSFYYDYPPSAIFLRDEHLPHWLPWLISKGYVEEVGNELEEHFRAFHNHREKYIFQGAREESSRKYWDYFDKNPVPREGK